jgi:hypothetical protein
MDKVEKLIEQLKDENEGVVIKATEALVEIGKPAVPVLNGALKDGIPKVRSSATYVLGKIGDTRAVPALVETLEDKYLNARSWAMYWLGGMIENLESKEDFQDFEAKLQEGYDRLKRKLKQEDLTETLVKIAELKYRVTQRKNVLAKDKGIILDDKPKPPKKGIYQQLRRAKNG